MHKIAIVLVTMLATGSILAAQTNGSRPSSKKNDASVISPRDTSTGHATGSNENPTESSSVKGGPKVKSHQGGKKGKKGATDASGKRQHPPS